VNWFYKMCNSYSPGLDMREGRIPQWDTPLIVIAIAIGGLIYANFELIRM
jgi:hypothetical protein